MSIEAQDFYEVHQSYTSNTLSDPFAEKIPTATPRIYYSACYFALSSVRTRR